MEIKLEYDWKTIKQNENNNYVFPKSATEYMKDNYNKPAIYKWEFKKDDFIEKIYIGQTNKLITTRLYQYRKPGNSQATNKRINCEITKWQNRYGYESVLFNILNLSEAKINGSPIDIAAKMESKNFRELIESALIEELRHNHDDSFFLNELGGNVEECENE